MLPFSSRSIDVRFARLLDTVSSRIRCATKALVLMSKAGIIVVLLVAAYTRSLIAVCSS